MEIQNLSLKIDTSGVTAAVDALNALAEAAERANAALAALGGSGRGVEVQIMGDLAHIMIAGAKEGAK